MRQAQLGRICQAELHVQSLSLRKPSSRASFQLPAFNAASCVEYCRAGSGRKTRISVLRIVAHDSRSTKRVRQFGSRNISGLPAVECVLLSTPQLLRAEVPVESFKNLQTAGPPWQLQVAHTSHRTWLWAAAGAVRCLVLSLRASDSCSHK